MDNGNEPPKKRHKRKTGPGLWIFVSIILITGLIYLASSHVDPADFFRPANIWSKIGRPILRTIAFISLGLLIGQIIESLGWTARLGSLVKPLINWSRLPGPAGAAFTTAFISGVFANTLIFTSWQEGKLDKKGLILANLLCNSLPVYVLHMPTTLFIALSLTGKAGLLYMAMMFFAALLRFIGVNLISRLIMTSCDVCEPDKAPEKRPLKEVWAETWPKFKQRLKRLVIVIVPVYFAVVLLAESGFFGWLRTAMAGWISTSVVPVEAMSLVVFSLVAEFTSGFAAAGALMQAGSLAVKDAVLALMIGNVAATPIRALRHQMPQYMGIYTPALGMQVIIINQSVRIVSVVLSALVLAWLY